LTTDSRMLTPSPRLMAHRLLRSRSCVMGTIVVILPPRGKDEIPDLGGNQFAGGLNFLQNIAFDNIVIKNRRLRANNRLFWPVVFLASHFSLLFLLLGWRSFICCFFAAFWPGY
jgi:hypothetical protein